MTNTQNKQIESNNLKILKDQLSHEALMTKKYSECSCQCNDQAVKDLCNEGMQVHKQNFTNLKNYLDSHQ